MWQNGTVKGRANLRSLQADQEVHLSCRLLLVLAFLDNGGAREAKRKLEPNHELEILNLCVSLRHGCFRRMESKMMAAWVYNTTRVYVV